MYISEGVNGKYCYACETVLDKSGKKYSTPGKCIGQIGGDGTLKPNRYLSHLLYAESTNEPNLSDFERRIIETVTGRYGESVRGYAAKPPPKPIIEDDIMTARAVFIGPEIVFGAIAKRYRIGTLLEKSFGEHIAKDIQSLAWYAASEGSALSDSDVWLDCYENPRGSAMSSQDISRLLGIIDYDGMMTFHKLWLKEATKHADKADKVLYDLTSISYYGSGIDAAEYGYNRDHESLPQVNYALLCMRSTAMPLFAWTLNGSIMDMATLDATLQFLRKLQYAPDCLMMDRGFGSKDNISGLFKNGYTFLQAVKVNANWIFDIIDASEGMRFVPDAKIDEGGRMYYASTSNCRWVRLKNEKGKESVIVHICGESARDRYNSGEKGVTVVAQYSCRVHILFCQDLVGNQHDRFMDRLKAERDRLIADESAEVKKEYAGYIKVYRKRYARHRTVEYDAERIAGHKNKYAGHICFITNDKTIATAADALKEYSTRDYIEKDFDEMKNCLDMKRIRVWSDLRMRSRLFIQFIAEIYMREIRVCLRKSNECKKLTRKQIFSNIKSIYRVKFKGKYNDVYPELTKQQRHILEALDVSYRG